MTFCSTPLPLFTHHSFITMLSCKLATLYYRAEARCHLCSLASQRVGESPGRFYAFMHGRLLRLTAVWWPFQGHLLTDSTEQNLAANDITQAIWQLLERIFHFCIIVGSRDASTKCIYNQWFPPSYVTYLYSEVDFISPWELTVCLSRWLFFFILVKNITFFDKLWTPDV